MKSSTLLALTTAALLGASSVYAGPNCNRECPRDGGSADEGVYEVVQRDGEGAEGETDRPQRRQRGEREEGERGDRPQHDGPFAGLELSEDQREQVRAIHEAAREEAHAVMNAAREAHENGEEVDRAAVREQIMAIRHGAFQNVYNNVLNDDQRAAVDERRERMEERRAEGGEEGERPRRPQRDGDGERQRPQRGERGGEGGGGLDL